MNFFLNSDIAVYIETWFHNTPVTSGCQLFGKDRQSCFDIRELLLLLIVSLIHTLLNDAYQS